MLKPDHANGSRAGITQRLLAGALLFTILAVLQGHHLGVGDLATYLPFLLHEHDPTFFANDLLIETLSAHPVYIWKGLAFFLDWIEAETLLKSLYLVQVLLITVAALWFYRGIFGGNRGWVLLLLMLVVSKKSPAMGLYGLSAYNYFHPGVVAFALALVAYLLLDRGKWWLGGALCGALFLLHPFTAVFMALTFAAKMAVDFRRVPAAQLVLGGVLLLLFSAPSWVPFFAKLLAESSQAFDKAQWLALVRMRMERSFFLSMWITDHYFHVAAVLAALFYFRRNPAFARVMPIIIATLAALLLKGMAELFSVKFLLQLQLARCTYFIYFLAAAFVANHVAGLDKKLASRDFIWLFLGYFMMIYSFVDRDSGLVPAAVILVAVGGLAYLLFRRGRSWWPIYRGIGFALILIMTADAVATTYRAAGGFFDRTDSRPWDDIQRWCQTHVAADQTIMTPFYSDGFRSLSQRSIYGSFKDGAPHNYSDGTIFRWWERMARFGIEITPRPDRGRFRVLYHQNAVRIAKEAGIRYIVYDRDWVDYDGIRLYENAGFGIVDLAAVPDPAFVLRQ